jgi:hypothetical protein
VIKTGQIYLHANIPQASISSNTFCIWFTSVTPFSVTSSSTELRIRRPNLPLEMTLMDTLALALPDKWHSDPQRKAAQKRLGIAISIIENPNSLIHHRSVTEISDTMCSDRLHSYLNGDVLLRNSKSSFSSKRLFSVSYSPYEQDRLLSKWSPVARTRRQG